MVEIESHGVGTNRGRATLRPRLAFTAQRYLTFFQDFLLLFLFLISCYVRTIVWHGGGECHAH